MEMNVGCGRVVETQGIAIQKRSNLSPVVSTVQISTYSYSYIGGTKRRLDRDRETGHFLKSHYLRVAVMHTAASVIADHVTSTSDNLKWSGNTKL